MWSTEHEYCSGMRVKSGFRFGLSVNGVRCDMIEETEGLVVKGLAQLLKKGIFICFMKEAYYGRDCRLLVGVGIGVTRVIGVWIFVVLLLRECRERKWHDLLSWRWGDCVLGGCVLWVLLRRIGVIKELGRLTICRDGVLLWMRCG